MSKKRGSLLSYRPDIKVVDATLRDGGLVNDFRFTEDFVRDLYAANVAAGIDYMEFGYKASKDIFDPKDFGPWKFCEEADLRNIVGDNDTDMNIMAISNAKESEITEALQLIGESEVDGIYLVDSYGSLYMEQIDDLSDQYLEAAENTGKFTGIHAHNNQQLAFANTITALTRGVSYLDATVNGMGRGAGNCASEQLLGFLKNPKYDIIPLLKFLEKHIVPLKESGVVWGYNIPYLLTGQMNRHPRSAIAATKEKRTDFLNFYLELGDKD